MASITGAQMINLISILLAPFLQQSVLISFIKEHVAHSELKSQTIQAVAKRKKSFVFIPTPSAYFALDVINRPFTSGIRRVQINEIPRSVKLAKIKFVKFQIGNENVLVSKKFTHLPYEELRLFLVIAVPGAYIEFLSVEPKLVAKRIKSQKNNTQWWKDFHSSNPGSGCKFPG